MLLPFIIYSEMGKRTWQADDAHHAIEQHRDAFPDEPIYRATLDWISAVDNWLKETGSADLNKHQRELLRAGLRRQFRTLDV
jgi:hypothetical protein